MAVVTRLDGQVGKLRSALLPPSLSLPDFLVPLSSSLAHSTSLPLFLYSLLRFSPFSLLTVVSPSLYSSVISPFPVIWRSTLVDRTPLFHPHHFYSLISITLTNLANKDKKTKLYSELFHFLNCTFIIDFIRNLILINN